MKKPTYIMLGPYLRAADTPSGIDPLMLFRFRSTHKFPWYAGSIICRTLEEALQAFYEWIPEPPKAKHNKIQYRKGKTAWRTYVNNGGR